MRKVTLFLLKSSRNFVVLARHTGQSATWLKLDTFLVANGQNSHFCFKVMQNSLLSVVLMSLSCHNFKETEFGLHNSNIFYWRNVFFLMYLKRTCFYFKKFKKDQKNSGKIWKKDQTVPKCGFRSKFGNPDFICSTKIFSVIHIAYWFSPFF